MWKFGIPAIAAVVGITTGVVLGRTVLASPDTKARKQSTRGNANVRAAA